MLILFVYVHTLRVTQLKHAKALQSCPTLGDPMDCSPPGFSIHGIFQTRVLEWGAIAFSYCMLTVCSAQTESAGVFFLLWPCEKKRDSGFYSSK